jgi:hypothetical protein
MVGDGEKRPNCVVGTVGKRDEHTFQKSAKKKNPKKKVTHYVFEATPWGYENTYFFASFR